MLDNILDKLNLSASNDDVNSQRAHERRQMDSCIGVIDGKAYPIENWSNGGVLLHGDDRIFSIDDVKPITMKFKIADRVMDIAHMGRVLRKGRDKFVIQFSPLTQEVDRKFKQVVDDYVTQEFISSQQ
jgi:hypothetical protein